MKRVSDIVANVTEDQIRTAAKRFESRRDWSVKDPTTYEAAILLPGDPNRNLFGQVTKGMTDYYGVNNRGDM